MTSTYSAPIEITTGLVSYNGAVFEMVERFEVKERRKRAIIKLHLPLPVYQSYHDPPPVINQQAVLAQEGAVGASF